MKFRQAVTSDLPILRELEQCVVEAERPFNSMLRASDVSYYDLEHLVSDDDVYLVVAESNHKIVATGYVQIRASKAYLKHDRYAYLGFMFVSPDHRGQGVNQKLLAVLVEWSKARDVTDFYLDVYAANTSAIKAYEKAGFQPSVLEMKWHAK